jgi:hypothetical protein
MKKLFAVILMATVVNANSATVCFEDGVTRCIQSESTAFESVLELLAYGDTTGAVYTISADKRNDSVTIRFKNGKDFLATINSMDAQKIPIRERPTVLSRLYK